MTNPERTSKRPRNARHHVPEVNLYDTAAGRANYEGFLPVPKPPAGRDTLVSDITEIPPEDVLFRREGAPVRYQEDDVYDRKFRDLKTWQKLPSSDLLAAVHRYASDFRGEMVKKEKVKGDRGREGKVWGSLDETALLAVGMLVEEAVREALGENGDLALVRGEEEVMGSGE